MSTDLPEGTDPIDADAVASIGDDVRDDELSFGAEGENDLGEDSWEPADRPAGVFRHGTTAAEGAEGARLDDRLRAEVPDVSPEDDIDPDATSPDPFAQGRDDDRTHVTRVARGQEGAARL